MLLQPLCPIGRIGRCSTQGIRTPGVTNPLLFAMLVIHQQTNDAGPAPRSINTIKIRTTEPI